MIIVVFTISKSQTKPGSPKCTLRCYSWSVSTKPGKYFVTGSGGRFLSLLMLQNGWQWFPTLAARLASHWSLGLAPQVSNTIGLDARTLQVGHGQPGKWAWTKSQTVTICFLFLFSNQIPQYFNNLATLCDKLTHWKRPWCWERLRAGGEGGGRGWYGWMASLTQWTWVWANSGREWRTGKPGVLQYMELQRAGHDWTTATNCQGRNCSKVTEIRTSRYRNRKSHGLLVEIWDGSDFQGGCNMNTTDYREWTR